VSKLWPPLGSTSELTPDASRGGDGPFGHRQSDRHSRTRSPLEVTINKIQR
jgi:hypothetical protein